MHKGFPGLRRKCADPAEKLLCNSIIGGTLDTERFIIYDIF